MKFITVISKPTQGQKDDGHKRQSSLGIGEKRPHVLAIIGNLPHGLDIFFDKHSAECLIEYLQGEIKTMVKYDCYECGRFESHFPKCDKCQKV